MRRRRETEVVLDLTEDTTGWLLEDRNYWFPRLQDGMRSCGISLIAPFRQGRRRRCERTNVLLLLERCINNLSGTDGHRPRSHQCWSTLSSRMGSSIKSSSFLNNGLGVFPRSVLRNDIHGLLVNTYQAETSHWESVSVMCVIRCCISTMVW